jgi:hypothetical protein
MFVWPKNENVKRFSNQLDSKDSLMWVSLVENTVQHFLPLATFRRFDLLYILPLRAPIGIIRSLVGFPAGSGTHFILISTTRA